MSARPTDTYADEEAVTRADVGETPRSALPNRLRNRDTAVAAAGLVLAAVILLFAADIPLGPEGPAVGPRWWPRALAGFMLLTAAVLAMNGIRRPSGPKEDATSITRHGFLCFLAVVALLPLYGLAWLNLDFRVCTPPFLAALSAVLGTRSWRGLIIFPVVLTTLIYLVFAMGLGVVL